MNTRHRIFERVEKIQLLLNMLHSEAKSLTNDMGEYFGNDSVQVELGNQLISELIKADGTHWEIGDWTV